MKFLTPCFVRVENAEEREKLLSWCYYEIGYVAVDIPDEEINGPFVICDGLCAGTVHYPEDFAELKYIDCGTDVELFKALAAMSDENTSGQWFVNDLGIWAQDAIFGTADEYGKMHSPRKATAEEIVAHFSRN